MIWCGGYWKPVWGDAAVIDRLTVYMLLIALLFIAPLMFWDEIKARAKDWMPIRYVRVGGIFQHLGKEEIKNILLPQVSTDFISADMKAIQDAVLSLPWVSRAEVKRIWPDAVDIVVYEQTPYVRWGEKSLLNEHGDVFSPENISEFGSLPLLSGPARQEKKLLNKMKELRTVLSKKSFDLSALTLNERRSWKMTLDNGMQFHLGRSDPALIIKRFMKTLTLLGEERINAISVIDMRYPNGFALTWKPDSTMNLEEPFTTEIAI